MTRVDGMPRRAFLAAAGAAAGTASTRGFDMPTAAGPTTDRDYHLAILEQMSAPVLAAMSRGELHRRFKPELSPTWDGRNPEVAYLECFGRLAAGISPWLAQQGGTAAERALRSRLLSQTQESYARSVNPTDADHLLWDREYQPLVDSAYYVNALLRAPAALWAPLDVRTKARVVESVKSLRRIAPPYTNWLLFAAMNEAFLLSIGEAWDPLRVEIAVRKLQEWYVGDGWYSDGPRFHLDYYGSFVMHPMLIEILEVLKAREVNFDGVDATQLLELSVRRMQRYSESLERLIGPDGAFPPIGRSLTYRTAVFQPIGLLALRGRLPASLPPGRVRAALTAAQRAVFDRRSNFDRDGFLRIGFAGPQPSLGDRYTNAGSMYLASLSLLPLGLPATDAFWSAAPEPWTMKLAFGGGAFAKDYYVDY